MSNEPSACCVRSVTITMLTSVTTHQKIVWTRSGDQFISPWTINIYKTMWLFYKTNSSFLSVANLCPVVLEIDHMLHVCADRKRCWGRFGPFYCGNFFGSCHCITQTDKLTILQYYYYHNRLIISVHHTIKTRFMDTQDT